VSNALKFTEHGTVQLKISRPAAGWRTNHPYSTRQERRGLLGNRYGYRYPAGKQRIILRPSNRQTEPPAAKYGEPAWPFHQPRTSAIAGGRNQVGEHTWSGQHLYSVPAAGVRQHNAGEGCGIATLQPRATRWLRAAIADSAVSALSPPRLGVTEILAEDLWSKTTATISKTGDPVLLIIEDDVTFARILVDMAEQSPQSGSGPPRATALSLAREFKPGAVTLDISLPDMVAGRFWIAKARSRHRIFPCT